MLQLSGSIASSRILGIDPGLNTTGYGVLEEIDGKPRVVEAGVIRSQQRRVKTTEMADRLHILYDGVVEVIEQLSPAAMAVEQLYAHYEHPRTAILMGHARGVILLAGVNRGLTVASYSATQIKKRITGSGHAGKEQMQYAIVRELGLTSVPQPHDVTDALAVALCHYYARKCTNAEHA